MPNLRCESFISKENKKKMAKCAKCLTFTRKSECFVSKENEKWQKCAKCLTFARKSECFVSKGNEKMAKCAKCSIRRFPLKKRRRENKEMAKRHCPKHRQLAFV
jgi:phosphotransferase system IIB component